MTGLLGAISFLTRLHVRRPPVVDPAIGVSIPWFPAVGAMIGMAVGGVYVGLRALDTPALVASSFAVLGGIVLTGALHEDGLADTADALAARDPESALAIMADPAHGTYGVVSLIASVLTRVAALAAVSPLTGLFIAALANMVGRGSAVGLMAASRRARGTGLGATYVDRTRRSLAIVGITPALVLVIGAARWAGLVAILAAVAITAASGASAHRRFTGVTGDVIGAVEQLTEVSSFLILGTVAARSLERA